MRQVLDAILTPPDFANDLFPINSRYRGTQVVTYTTPDGHSVSHLRRRFIHSPESYSTLQEHLLVEGDRYDNLAHQYLGDAEQWWRICDANVIADPNDVADRIGTSIRITLPPGIPGGDDA